MVLAMHVCLLSFDLVCMWSLSVSPIADGLGAMMVG